MYPVGSKAASAAGAGVGAGVGCQGSSSAPGAAAADNAGQIKAGAEGPRAGRSRRIAGESLARAQPFFSRGVFVSLPGMGLGSWG